MQFIVDRDDGCICDNCYPRGKNSWGVPTEIDGLVLSSKFEAKCYIKISNFFMGKNILIQQKYDNTFNTNTSFTCDFVIDKLWIEVSTIKLDTYLKKINRKRKIVEGIKGYSFLFINSYDELDNLFWEKNNGSL